MKFDETYHRKDTVTVYSCVIISVSLVTFFSVPDLDRHIQPLLFRLRLDIMG